MAEKGPAPELRRLAELYARMHDAELEKLADEWDELSDVARAVLGEELVKRGYELEPEPKSRSDGPLLEKLVAIRWFRDLPEALLAKGTLDSAGVASHLRDDNIVRMSWLYSNLAGGVKLLVREEDVEQAERVLSQPVPGGFAVEGVGDYQQPRCPRCDALDIRYRELNQAVGYVSIGVFVPIPLPQPKWTCDACGAQWQKIGVADEENP